MKIVSAKLYKLKLKLKKPFVTGFGQIKHKETLIVELLDESGCKGYGEASSLHAPIYNHESVDICRLVIERYLLPIIIGKDLGSVEEVIDIFDIYEGNNIAKASVEFALWDIYSQLVDKSLVELWGGSKKSIEIGANSIGIQNSIRELLSLVKDEVSSGLDRVKLKIKPGYDIDILDSVRDKYPDISLMVDANSSYDLLKHRDILRKLDDYSLVMIEQPLGTNTIVGHSLLQKELKTPICLDESIKDIETTKDAIESEACKIVNIKPARVGGAIKTIQINNLLKKNGIESWCGGMLETSIGRAYNIILSSLDNFDYPADISTYDHYFVDIVEKEPFPLNGNKIEAPTNPGLGFSVDSGLLERMAVGKIIIES